MTPIPDDAEQMQQNRVDVPALAPATARSPLRDISPPLPAQMPQHDDDIKMEPRRRIPANSSLNHDTSSASDKNLSHNRPIAVLPSRQTRTSAGGASDDGDDVQMQRRPPTAEQATLVFAGSQSKNTTSAYFNGNAIASGSSTTRLRSQEINTAVDELDFNFEPTGRQLSRILPSPDYFNDEDPFDFDLLDEMDQENQPPVSTDKGKGRQDPSSVPKASTTVHDDASSDDYGMDDLDDLDPSFLEECDKIEKSVITKTGSAHPSSSTTVSSIPTTNSSIYVPPPPNAVRSSGIPRIVDVIEIDDSDDEIFEADDKENAPVATRHVRRRTDPDTQPSQSQNHGSQNTRKKTGQPVVLATNPDDIIDLSDSD